jgi:hypothetical protein
MYMMVKSLSRLFLIHHFWIYTGVS